jgi:rhodanese-related sulfurtransferase
MKLIPFKEIQQDFIRFWILTTVALCLGLLVNQFRDTSLPLIYQTKQQRLDESVSHLAATGTLQGTSKETPASASVESLPENLSLEEFQAVATQKKALVLDARPEIFYRLGHVPRSLALPRDEFENYYHKLQSQLEKEKNQPLVIYCSSTSCEDSGLVAASLKKLGYTHVSIFHGGWNDWTQAGLPQEKSQ